MPNIKELESDIGYSFKDESIIDNALIHPSYANEHGLKKIDTNQRLEFLGDSVLELISSEYLYKHFCDLDEGKLTKLRAKLVCEESLSSIARSLRLYEYLKLGNGESRNKVKDNNSIMCDTIEAIIGAIYLDSDLNSAYDFILKYILTDDNLSRIDDDYKSILQEIVNSKYKSLSYILKNESGPDHKKCFSIDLYIDDNYVSSGVGKSKKEAEQNAARIALNTIMKG